MARIYFLWTYFNTRFKQEKKTKKYQFFVSNQDNYKSSLADIWYF